MHKEEQERQIKNFYELVQLDDKDLVANTTMIECPVCYDIIPAGQGVVLRECLHSSCRYRQANLGLEKGQIWDQTLLTLKSPFMCHIEPFVV
jgi:hypothetical protein